MKRKECNGQKNMTQVKIKLSNNQGVTMVETLVAFTVLMIVLGILYGIISFCNILRMRAHDTSQAVVSFGEQMYNQNNVPDADNSANRISITSFHTKDNEPLFYLSLSKDTDEANFGTAGEAYYDVINPNLANATDQQIENAKTAQEKLWISLYQIEAVTYAYLPTDGETQEKILIPKALRFVHKEDQ